MTTNELSEHKAKSRISIERKVDLVDHTSHHQPRDITRKTPGWISRFRQPLNQRSNQPHRLSELFHHHSLKARLPSIIIAGLLFFILILIVTTIPPSSVANIILYQSYLPVLFVVMLACYFLGKVVFTSNRATFFSSLLLTLLLFLKLQAVELSFLVVLVPFLFFIGLELILKLVFRK